MTLTGFEIVFFGMLMLQGGYILGWVAGERNERLRSVATTKEETPAMKTHLKDSSEPITEGLTQTAICGTEVKDAVFVISVDDDLTLLNIKTVVRSIIGLCPRCKKVELKERYIYGITEAQNLRERGAGEITQC